jgi:hypothetical protein
MSQIYFRRAIPKCAESGAYSPTGRATCIRPKYSDMDRFIFVAL